MATKTIIISEIKSNDKFINVKDNSGIEYGISREKSPNLTKTVESLKVGDELTGDYFLWKDKHYLSDIKSGGEKGTGKSFAPKNHAREAAFYAAQAAGSTLALQKDVTLDKFKEYANGIHEWIMSKTSL